MNHDEIYQKWKERPASPIVTPDFIAKVLRRVHEKRDARRRIWNYRDILEFFQRNIAIQYAAIGVAAIAGLGRLWLIFFALLNP